MKARHEGDRMRPPAMSVAIQEAATIPAMLAGRGSGPLAGLGPFPAWAPHDAACLGAAMRTAKAGSLLKASALFKMAL